MVKRTIDFRHDPIADIVIATPHWSIETEADVLEWYEQYAKYLTPFGRKVDFIAVLDDFSIAPAVAVLWGEYRAKHLKNFTRHSYRVHANNRVRLFVNTSGVRYDVATQEAATIEDAIDGIKAARLNAKTER